MNVADLPAGCSQRNGSRRRGIDVNDEAPNPGTREVDTSIGLPELGQCEFADGGSRNGDDVRPAGQTRAGEVQAAVYRRADGAELTHKVRVPKDGAARDP